jgi:hypothetical protein
MLLAALAVAAPAGAAPAKSTPESDWVRISYRELLDPDVLTHSGTKLIDALPRKSSRGDVQPFLDPFTSLLGYAVQMLSGADTVPQTSLAERYPAGSEQPAWAAILREGKYAVSTDGQGRARVFVPGKDPRDAYRQFYSLLRHPLAAALTPGAALQVEVYSYRNDYATAELSLNPAPFRIRARSFPPQGRPVDLDELEALFRKRGQLEGAGITPDGGLALYASELQQQRLGGEAVSLSDFAVAYRAVFHAGDAEAFVSLDPHVDPTLATVNFGGLLEDTRIGKAVLAADMRFKTICSGLDPFTLSDIRDKTRFVVPSFMSNSERHFLVDPSAEPAQWVIARYWYYPDSCGVESDDNDRLAAVTRTQLTADVERMDAGTEATAGGKSGLPAIFQENIDDLNKNYARYAEVFPEYRDLSSAARLMALAAWLGRVRPQGLDLDGLLAVTLPPERTPRVLPQLLTADILTLPGKTPPNREYVLANTRVRYLTPELDKSVSDYFGNPLHLAVFLAFKAGKDASRASEFTAEAERLLTTAPNSRVRDLLRTLGDLHAFLRTYAVRRIAEISSAQQGASERDRRRLNEIRTVLAALPAAATAQEGAVDPRRQSLENEMRDILRTLHAPVNNPGASTVVGTQYLGGISLAPRLFTVKKTVKRPALEKLKATVAKTPAQSPEPAAGKVQPQPLLPGDTPEELAPAPPAAKPAMSSIAVPGSATPAGTPLVGRPGEGRRIVFTPSPR